MSIRFSVMKWLVQLLGTKRLTSLPPEKMLRRIRHTNQRNHFFVPQDEEFLYRDEVISLTGIDGAEGFADQEQKASFHCLTICHKEQAEKMCIRDSCNTETGQTLTQYPACMQYFEQIFHPLKINTLLTMV